MDGRTVFVFAGLVAASAIAAAGVTWYMVDWNADGAPDVFARARESNAKYARVADAEADGFVKSTGFVAQVGYHWLHPTRVQAPFDPLAPAGLVYVPGDGGELRLAALHYVLPRATNVPPAGFAGDDDRWDVHEASCHFVDGTQVQAAQAGVCPAENPATQAAFSFWHPDVWNVRLWLYVDNPDGRFAPRNPNVG